MLSAKTAEKLTGLIGNAANANAEELKRLRGMFVDTVGEIGPRNFVEAMAAILSEVLKSPGCDDVKLPLKRIFNISLQELSEILEKKRFHLPDSHPISLLGRDHVESIRRLRELDAFFASVHPPDLQQKMASVRGQFNAFFTDLDRHIRKEEEVLFPELSAAGMKEHPDVLKEEHKNFRRWCADLENVVAHKLSNNVAQVIETWRSGFVPAICNHIFRETNVFYPAALEFITAERDWKSIAERFSRISETENKA